MAERRRIVEHHRIRLSSELMKYLLLRSLALFSAVFLTISAAMLLGRMQPIPSQVALLHLGEMCELPCWLGITPGKARVGEARQIIADIYNSGNPTAPDQVYGTMTITSPDGLLLYITLNEGGGDPPDTSEVVRRIDLAFGYDEPPIPLGDMIAAVGTPDSIDMGYDCCAGVAVLKPWARIYLPDIGRDYSAPRHIHPLQGVNQLALFLPADEPYPVPWHGFGYYQ